jgi:hypothetical protein
MKKISIGLSVFFIGAFIGGFGAYVPQVPIPLIPDTRSDLFRTVILIEGGQSFRFIPDTLFPQRSLELTHLCSLILTH